MQTVLISGGTGLVGKALGKLLIEKGYQVIVLTRNVANKKDTANLRFAFWNVKKQEIDLAAIQQADYIVHLAGAGVVDKKWSKVYKQEIVDSRTLSSKLIVDCLKQNTNKVKAVISASAIGWYGADSLPPVSFNEKSPAAAGFLGETCRLWESGIEPVISLGKRLVTLRIGIVLSKDGGALTEFKKPIRLGIAAILGSGKQMISWIHISDLCRIFLNAIENEKFQGIYNAVAPQPVTNKELTITLAKAMNGRYYIPVHVPAFILKAFMGESSTEVLKSTTVSCKKLIDNGFTFAHNSITPAINNLLQR